MGPGLVVVGVASVGGHRTGGVGAGAGSDPDGFGESAGRVAAEFACVEQSAAVVGEQSGEQHLVTATVRVEGGGDQFSRRIAAGIRPDRSASSAGVVQAEQAGQRHDDPDPGGRGAAASARGVGAAAWRPG